MLRMNEEPVKDTGPQLRLEPDDKAKAEYEKITVETTKLREEIQRLRSENSPLGRLGRVVWPLVTGALTAVVSFVALNVSWQSLSFNTEQEHKKTFFSALQMATDAKSGQDARIAGIWTLVDYWHDPQYSDTLANALAAILATDPDDASPQAMTKVQRLRLTAAAVIGKAITETTSRAEGERLRKLLYGDGPSGTLGAVTRYQQDLSALKTSLLKGKQNTESMDLSLQATREAIRQNWENLEFSQFALHDLTGIDLYRADAKGAYFGGAKLTAANLCGANLSQANFDRADLSYAELSNADIASTYGWSTANLAGANVHNIRNATGDFVAAAKKAGALDLPHAAWLANLKSKGVKLPDFAVYTDCDR
jgi:uncharacterized protein YjbI with pentapeptide repeats